MMNFKLAAVLLLLSTVVSAKDLSIGDPAPLFSAQTHEGKAFDLASRKGQWTVLYFYPKAETPGCTKQACAFRDSIQKIRAQGADVFGVSVNSVEEQASFHKKHQLSFALIADPKAEITNLYGSQMPILKMSKRWTFVIDPDLKIRDIEKDVDPAADADRTARKLAELKNQKS